MGIEALFVTGVYTNECVETTVRDACDLGYLVTLIEDGCTTVTPQLHEASLQTLRNRYCRIITTEQGLADIERHVRETRNDSLPLDTIQHGSKAPESDVSC